MAKIPGDVPISLTLRWVGQQFREHPPMIRHVCRHGRGFGPEYPILVTTERLVGTNQIVAGHADGEYVIWELGCGHRPLWMIIKSPFNSTYPLHIFWGATNKRQQS